MLRFHIFRSQPQQPPPFNMIFHLHHIRSSSLTPPISIIITLFIALIYVICFLGEKFFPTSISFSFTSMTTAIQSVLSAAEVCINPRMCYWINFIFCVISHFACMFWAVFCVRVCCHCPFFGCFQNISDFCSILDWYFSSALLFDKFMRKG